MWSPFAIGLVACAFLLGPAEGATPESRMPLPATSELVARVQNALPPGWSIQGRESSRVPPGWKSERAEGTIITISDGKDMWTLSFVPLDWVGIQVGTNSEENFNGIDRVGRSDDYKVLYAWARQSEWPWLQALARSGPGLYVSQENPKADIAKADSESLRLVRRHCRNQDQRSNAAFSLVNLRVPAATVFRDVAVNGRSRGRELAISALGELKQPDAMPALREVLRDPRHDYDTDLARKYAVYSCRALNARDHGPDLRVALGIARNDETTAAIANEINRIAYAPAVPELRRWLRRCDNPYFVGAYAQALATLRAIDAIPDIQEAMTRDYDVPGSAANRSNRPAQMAALAVQLHRLTGAWGEARDGLRAALVDRGSGRIALYVENLAAVGSGYFQFDHHADGIWPIDAQVWVDDVLVSPPRPNLGIFSGRVPTIDPGTVVIFEFDLSRSVIPGREHHISGSWREIPTNDITVDRHEEPADSSTGETTP